jgi:hypothetical protein
MRIHVARGTLMFALVLAAAPALAAQNFSYDCRGDRFASEPLGTAHEFRAPIAASPPDADSIDVDIDISHLPSGWFAQYCQTSTGICYFDDYRIRVAPGNRDSLRIDIFPDWQAPGMGWVNMTLRSAVDPLDVEHCTYTLYSGIPVPSHVSFSMDCHDNTRWVSGGDLVDMFSPFKNTGYNQDTLLVHITTGVPDGWYTQYCQTSTGTCYFGDAGLPMAPARNDTLRIDFFTSNIHGAGWMDLEFHSKKNPSMFAFCHYQVFHGSYQSAVPDVVQGTPKLSVVVQPNPFLSSTVLELRAAAAGPGSLSIFSADGRLVRSFAGIPLTSGATQVRWDGRTGSGDPAPAGVYFFRLKAGSESARGLLVRTR